MNRLQISAHALALVFAIGKSPAAATPAPAPTPTPTEVTVLFCGGALNTARIVQSVAGTTATADTLKTVRNSEIALVHRNHDVLVSRGAVAASVPWTEPSDRICLTQPDGSTILSSATSLSGQLVAMLGAVFHYRNEHPWPTAYPAHIDADDTDVYVTQRGRYDHVFIEDNPKRHFDAKAGNRESCSYQEFYRVDPRTLQVLPFNGCLVGGQLLKGVLPDALHLPH